MRKFITAALAASLLALPIAPASAMPVDPAPQGLATTGDAGLQQVAFRHRGGFGGHRFGGVHRGGFHRGGFGGHRFGGFRGRHFGGFRGGFGGRRYYGGRRFGVGAGIAGLAAGAIIGSAIAGSAHAANSVAYCESRFKSYNPATGTYLGYDGLRHRCP